MRPPGAGQVFVAAIVKKYSVTARIRVTLRLKSEIMITKMPMITTDSNMTSLQCLPPPVGVP